ncbi:MAG: hypothetical protein S4CHLAM37_07560 [Chlamydiia bacterium]|nr:hypothetical protein [Chlamydiia bacterium]
MNWDILEKIFDRALSHSFSRKKFFFTFPTIAACGLLIIFCKILSMGSGDWVTLSLTFLPIFLSSGFLLATGVVLTRVYHHEIKGTSFSFRKVLKRSWQMLMNISYLALPLLLAYLLLWTFMGVFYLLKELPGIGDMIGIVLAFGPFLLVLGAIVLGLFNLIVLFFVTPEAALKTGVKLKLAEAVYLRLKKNIFSNTIMLMVGMIPLVVCLAILYLAAHITGGSFFQDSTPLSLTFQWFFVMLPFCALLTPFVVFFFNFATECFVYSSKKAEEKATPS